MNLRFVDLGGPTREPVDGELHGGMGGRAVAIFGLEA